MPKGVPKPITVENIKFRSFRSACMAYNLEPMSVKKRLDRNWTIEEAFCLVERKSSHEIPGIVYKIINNHNSKIYIGITTSTLNTRFNQHVYEAINGRKTKLYDAMREIGKDNFKIIKLKNCSKRYELAKLEVYYIKKYNSIQKGYNMFAGGGSLGDRCGTPIEYEGIKFVSVKALANYVGLPNDTTHYRMKNGIPLRSALKQTKGQKIKYKNKNYKNIQELADYLDLSYNIVHYRLANKISLKIPSGEAKRVRVKYKNKIYNGVKILANHLGISTASINRMINSGKVERLETCLS